MMSLPKKAQLSKIAAVLIGPLCFALLSICAEVPEDKGKKTGLP